MAVTLITGATGFVGRHLLWDILNNAASRGYVGLSVLEHPDMGDGLDQYLAGMRMDQSHLSQRGASMLASTWIELLKQAAHDPCLLADVDFNGVHDIFDLLLFLEWFQNGDEAADWTGDETLDVFDVLGFLNDFGVGC